MTTWRRLRELTLADWAVLAEALVLHPPVAIALRLLPLPRLVALCQGGGPMLPRAGATDDEPAVARLTELVGLAGRGSPGSTCLTRALVASTMLRRRAIGCRLRIGVARRDGAVAAHAWLEHGGRPFPDRAADGYEPLAS